MADIPRPYSPFSDSMLSSRSVLRMRNGFHYCKNKKKTDTLCNENNYGTEKKKKKKKREQEEV